MSRHWPYAGIGPERVREQVEKLRLVVQEADDKLGDLDTLRDSILRGKADCEARIAELEAALDAYFADDEDDVDDELVDGEPERIRITKNPGMPDEYVIVVDRYPDGREVPVP